MATVNASKVVLSPAIFEGNTNITSMDLQNTPFVGDCMYKAFYRASNLTAVTNINENVVDMTACFAGCSKLVSVPAVPPKVKTLAGTIYKDTLNIGGAFSGTKITSAPSVAATVTNMLGTYANCTSLTSAGTIPLGVTDTRYCYAGCTSLAAAPTIPSSVVNVSGMYSGCTALTGNVRIESNIITDATNCFSGTSTTKNVYIPFYSSGTTYSQTYNSFIAAGYKTDGSKEGVYLKDLSTL